MKWYTRSCERPRKRSASEALPASVANWYFLSIRTHGSSCRRRATSSLRRVSSFAAWGAWRRAAVQTSRDTTLCSRVDGLFCTMLITFFFPGLMLFTDNSNGSLSNEGARDHPSIHRSRGVPGAGLNLFRDSGPGLADGAHLAAGGAAAVEDSSAVALKTGHRNAGGHVELFEDFTRVRIYAAKLAFLGFQCAVPELAVDPGNARDESIRFDGAEDGAGPGVNLVNLAGAVLSNPERPLGPRQARVATVCGRGDGGDDLPRARIDLLDPGVGDLPQVFAIEGSAGLGGDGDLANH